MVEAYNKRAENKIEINIPSLPYNLFSKEAEAFKGTINFNNNTLWTIRLLISKPYEEEKIPTILINIITGKELVDSVRKRSESLLRLPSDLMLSINIYNKTINSIKTGSNKYFGKLDEQCSINADNYKKSIKDIFTTLFEYQLIE